MREIVDRPIDLNARLKIRVEQDTALPGRLKPGLRGAVRADLPREEQIECVQQWVAPKTRGFFLHDWAKFDLVG